MASAEREKAFIRLKLMARIQPLINLRFRSGGRWRLNLHRCSTISDRSSRIARESTGFLDGRFQTGASRRNTSFDSPLPMASTPWRWSRSVLSCTKPRGAQDLIALGASFPLPSCSPISNKFEGSRSHRRRRARTPKIIAGHFRQQINETPMALRQAASGGNIEDVKALLRDGADPNLTDHLGSGPLHVAAEHGHLNVTRALLDAGADPSIPDGYGSTPLLYAVRDGHFGVARLLLECNASAINARNTDGLAPIHIASIQGNFETVRLLLEHKASTAGSGHWGQLPLHYAAKRGHTEVCELLLEYGKNSQPGPILRLLGAESDISSTTLNKFTAFALAVDAGQVEVAEMFMRKWKVSPKSRDGYKVLLFHKTVKVGNCQMAKLFLDYGAPVDMKGDSNERALHIAVENGHADIVGLLLEYGASPKSKDAYSCSPMDKARTPEIMALIRDAQALQQSSGKGS
jgi:ankyrin repeat protein